MLESENLVQESWASVVGAAPRFAELFFGRLVEVDPQLGRALRGVEPREHGRRFVEAVTALVSREEDGGSAAGGWPDPRAGVVGEALLWTLERMLGGRFTPQARSAWRELAHRHAAALHTAALGEAAMPRMIPRGSRRLVQVGS